MAKINLSYESNGSKKTRSYTMEFEYQEEAKRYWNDLMDEITVLTGRDETEMKVLP